MGLCRISPLPLQRAPVSLEGWVQKALKLQYLTWTLYMSLLFNLSTWLKKLVYKILLRLCNPLFLPDSQRPSHFVSNILYLKTSTLLKSIWHTHMKEQHMLPTWFGIDIYEFLSYMMKISHLCNNAMHGLILQICHLALLTNNAKENFPRQYTPWDTRDQ